MKFNEQILENNLNIIKSYSSNHIYIQGKKYNYNVIVPPEKSIIKCKDLFVTKHNSLGHTISML